MRRNPRVLHAGDCSRFCLLAALTLLAVLGTSRQISAAEPIWVTLPPHTWNHDLIVGDAVRLGYPVREGASGYVEIAFDSHTPLLRAQRGQRVAPVLDRWFEPHMWGRRSRVLWSAIESQPAGAFPSRPGAVFCQEQYAEGNIIRETIGRLSRRKGWLSFDPGHPTDTWLSRGRSEFTPSIALVRGDFWPAPSPKNWLRLTVGRVANFPADALQHAMDVLGDEKSAFSRGQFMAIYMAGGFDVETGGVEYTGNRLQLMSLGEPDPAFVERLGLLREAKYLERMAETRPGFGARLGGLIRGLREGRVKIPFRAP